MNTFVLQKTIILLINLIMLNDLHHNLARFIQNAASFKIEEKRYEDLDFLIQHIVDQLKLSDGISLNFICTHNSRRSQISQIWAQTAAYIYNVPITTYSGGVEVTAFNFRAVRALRKIGFQITGTPDDNPKYQVSFSDKTMPINAFSKTFDDPENPKENFSAIMTCAHADEHCPFISGADARIPLRYEDPKIGDDTPAEESKYDERVLQIGAEMLYIFQQISIKL